MLHCGKTKIGATERSIIQSFTRAVNETPDNIPAKQSRPLHNSRLTIFEPVHSPSPPINNEIKPAPLLNQRFTSLVAQLVHLEINSLSIISITIPHRDSALPIRGRCTCPLFFIYGFRSISTRIVATLFTRFDILHLEKCFYQLFSFSFT